MRYTDAVNNVKVYNLSLGRTLPSWLSSRRRRKLTKQNSDIQKDIQLIQDFGMPDLSTCIDVTEDGQYILVTGTYAPRLKCFDTSALSLKFERGLEENVVKFVSIEKDYSKLIFLQENKSMEFHSKGGRLCRLKIPNFGRDVVFDGHSSDVYITSSVGDVFRINLEYATFMESLQTESNFGNNVCKFSPERPIFFVGGENGILEAHDSRTSSRVSFLDCTPYMQECGSRQKHKINGITALDVTGPLTLAVGTSTGQALIYDIRSTQPMVVKHHYDNSPVFRLKFHSSGNVISMTERAVHIWDQQTTDIHTVVETPELSKLNDMCVIEDSGMIMLAQDTPKMGIHFIPSIGPAPRWCPYLDIITEEMEGQSVNVYENYKFVTAKELQQLGLEHLIGTLILKPSLHGFYIHLKLYNKALAYAQKDNNNEIGNFINTKINDESKVKILPKTVASVNPELYHQIGGKVDPRLSALFDEREMQIKKEIVTQMSKLSKNRKLMKEEEECERVQFVKERDGISSSEDEEDRKDHVEMDDSSDVESSTSEDDNATVEKFISKKPLNFVSGSSVNDIKKFEDNSKRLTLEESLIVQPKLNAQKPSKLGHKEVTFKVKSKKNTSRKEKLMEHTKNLKLKRSTRKFTKRR